MSLYSLRGAGPCQRSQLSVAGRRSWVAVMRGAARVGIPGFGHVGLADVAVVDLLDHLDRVIGGALLVANLDQLSIFLLRGHNQFAFARILARGFFHINVLAGLEAENRHRRVPVVGCRNRNGIDFFRFEGVAEIAFGLRRIAKHLLGFGGKLGANVVVHVADVGDTSRLAVGAQR